MRTPLGSVLLLFFSGIVPIRAQTCLTQARMDAAVRSSLQEAATAVGNAVKANDASAVKAATVPELAGSFAATEALIRSTSAKLVGDSPRVSQIYTLDASNRKAGDAGSADFTCMSKDANIETDFSINGLPPGMYGFTMVEAADGPQPWLLSMLFQKQGNAWKLAGFYPKPRTAAGHDGLWYWTNARVKAAAKQSLLSWLYYSEADALLRPAPFVSSTNLEKLRTEQRSAGPPELVNGLSAESPLIVHGNDGADYRFNSLVSDPADDGKSLHLIAHVAESPTASADVIRANSEAAGRALVKAHPALRQAYGALLVFADGPPGNPPVVTLATSQLQ